MHLRLLSAAILYGSCGSILASNLDDALIFRATFDRSANADIAAGDPAIYTAKSLKRQQITTGLKSKGVQWQAKGGRRGGALHFMQKSDQLVFFKGGKNVPYATSNFQGCVSFWMRVTPTEDLPEGFVDPLQITEKAWNNGSFFVDFDRAPERDFRLGVFADYDSWNPQARAFDDIPIHERPMVIVRKAPFMRSRWTHVVWTWQGFNTEKKGDARLYLDGKLQGKIDQAAQRFTWDPANVVIMLGINYVGWIDDLSIFKRALSPAEIVVLQQPASANTD